MTQHCWVAAAHSEVPLFPLRSKKLNVVGFQTCDSLTTASFQFYPTYFHFLPRAVIMLQITLVKLRQHSSFLVRFPNYFVTFGRRRSVTLGVSYV